MRTESDELFSLNSNTSNNIITHGDNETTGEKSKAELLGARLGPHDLHIAGRYFILPSIHHVVRIGGSNSSDHLGWNDFVRYYRAWPIPPSSRKDHLPKKP